MNDQVLWIKDLYGDLINIAHMTKLEVVKMEGEEDEAKLIAIQFTGSFQITNTIFVGTMGDCCSKRSTIEEVLKRKGGVIRI